MAENIQRNDVHLARLVGTEMWWGEELENVSRGQTLGALNLM